MSIQEIQNPKAVTIQYKNVTAQIDLFGATVTSWKIDGEELMFVSSKSKRDGSKAVRGGIPIVFPQFGKEKAPNPAHALPQHGFARSFYWKHLEEEGVKDDSGVTAHFGLTHEDISKEVFDLWPFKFELKYSVTITEKELKTFVQVKNLNTDKELTLTPLLHTYFDVENIANVKVEGLKGLDYYNKVLDKNETQQDDHITIDQEVDRVYGNKNDDLLKLYKDEKSYFTFVTVNLPDVVVWNPWIKNAKAMSDMDDEEYHKFICVELGHVKEPIKVTPAPSINYLYGQIITYHP
ncbi:galactose mutarotase-like protein [Neoconidiobolus thromboides FSU 785]|nr:galactose mutarotase-like protein [Neoconidiobolus thromboides FSU 785]